MSKDTLDICLKLEEGRSESFKEKNSEEGFEKILERIMRRAKEGVEVRICLEATSSCHKAVCWWMVERGVRVKVLAPKQARDLARGLGILRKNDATDARVLALCSEKAWDEPRLQPGRKASALQELSRRIDCLKSQVADEKKRLGKPSACGLLTSSCRKVIKLLDEEVRRLSELWLKEMKAIKGMKEKHALLLTVPGVGPETARKVLSELYLTDEPKGVDQCVAYAGLAPQESSSGTSLHRKASIHGTGNKQLRTALYMGAVSCSHKDKECRAHYERLIARGKPVKVALAAIMARMMRRIATVVLRGTPWVKTLT